MRNMLILLAVILAVLMLVAIVITRTDPFSRKKKKGPGPVTAIFSYIALAVHFFITVTAFLIYQQSTPAGNIQNDIFTPDVTTNDAIIADVETEPVATETDAPTTEAYRDPRLSFQPQAITQSEPGNFQLNWEIIVNDEIVESFTREDPICFELDKEYFALPGIATFRGSNYRDNATYGTALIEKETMGVAWSHRIGSLDNWGGCAWTGQPLVVQWDAESKAIMNMYESKKNKEDLVEVIYATLDGYIHFYDLEDGSKTRDAISMGMNFKGAGALDPRGYPLLYVGSGLYTRGASPRMFVVSLIDGKIIYQHGNNDPFAIRDWSAFDSSPLVDAESDTLIWPGESGLLYTIKLNTEYDKEAGTISVNPDTPVKTRYTSYYSTEGKRYLGYEASSSIVDHYLFTSENGGLFQCVDLNTMELVWAQDTKDDSNSSPVFEWGKDGNGYIYTAPSLHWTAQNHKGSISIYKMDASNGKIIWQYERDCVRYDDIAGGVQCTPLLGKAGSNIDGLIIYAVGRTSLEPDDPYIAYRGVLVALDKETGEKIWEISTGNYAWSSPTALYTHDGHAYIFQANASGVCRLIDGSTGEVLANLNLNETVEASPVVFGNMLVIGSREGVYGIKVS
jgi:outer membrane protein assembly factor BamB